MADPSFDDVLALVRRHIQADTTEYPKLGGTINATIGGRVRGPSLLDADAVNVERPVVILDGFGGSAEYGKGMAASTVYIYAYSDESQGHARALYDAVYASLQAARLHDPDGVITAAGSARETSRPVGGTNDKMQSHFARGVWQITLAG